MPQPNHMSSGPKGARRVGKPTGLSQAEPAGSLGPSGFDPSRIEMAKEAEACRVEPGGTRALASRAARELYLRRHGWVGGAQGWQKKGSFGKPMPLDVAFRIEAILQDLDQ